MILNLSKELMFRGPYLEKKGLDPYLWTLYGSNSYSHDDADRFFFQSCFVFRWGRAAKQKCLYS